MRIEGNSIAIGRASRPFPAPNRAGIFQCTRLSSFTYVLLVGGLVESTTPGRTSTFRYRPLLFPVHLFERRSTGFAWQTFALSQSLQPSISLLPSLSPPLPT